MSLFGSSSTENIPTFGSGGLFGSTSAVSGLPCPVPAVVVKAEQAAAAEKGSIASDLAALLESPDGADVTLVVGVTELPAHSQILAARSPVFAAMLRTDMKESRTRRIEVHDMREVVLRQLLSFIYTDTAPELGSVAEELLPIADKYDLPLLKKRCEDKMAQEVSVENAAATAKLAVLHRCQKLRESAVKFIARHPQVLATGGWARMLRGNPEVAVEVCQQLAAELPHRIQREDPPKALQAKPMFK